MTKILILIDRLATGIIATTGLILALNLSLEHPIAILLFLSFSYITGILLNIVSYWIFKPIFISSCLKSLNLKDKDKALEEIQKRRNYIYQKGSKSIISSLNNHLRTLVLIRSSFLAFIILLIPFLQSSLAASIILLIFIIILIKYIYWKEDLFVKEIIRKYEMVKK